MGAANGPEANQQLDAVISWWWIMRSWSRKYAVSALAGPKMPLSEGDRSQAVTFFLGPRGPSASLTKFLQSPCLGYTGGADR